MVAVTTTTDPRAKALLDRADRLKADRSNFENHWQQLHDYILPDGEHHTRQADRPGTQSRTEQLQGAGEDAANDLASAMHGLLTNPGTKWAGLEANLPELNERHDTRVWLDDTTRRMYALFNSPRARMVSALEQYYLRLGVEGTHSIFVDAKPGELPTFISVGVKDTLLAEGPDGLVDTVFRPWSMPAGAAVRFFADDATEKMRAKAEKKPDELLHFMHAVLPRDERRAGVLARTDRPVASFWVSVDERRVVREGGYHELPYITGRWQKRASEAYGRGPGSRALPNVKMLQRMARSTVRGGEKSVDPPLLVADDGVLSPVRVSPSGLIHVRSELMGTQASPVRPLMTGSRPDLGVDLMDWVVAGIQRAFMVHLIRVPRDARMTATQVITINEEAMRALGPVLGRQQEELLGPLIARVYGLMARGGFLLPAPPDLAASGIKPVFVSPLAKAQALTEVRGFTQWLEIMNPAAERDPALLDLVDFERAGRDVADRLGVPPTWLNSPAKVKAMREARQAAEEERAGAENFAEMAKAMAAATQVVPNLQSGGVSVEAANAA